MTGYAYLWGFNVKPGSEAEFELHYSSDGTWTQLFRHSPDFIETVLTGALTQVSIFANFETWHTPSSTFMQKYKPLSRLGLWMLSQTTQELSNFLSSTALTCVYPTHAPLVVGCSNYAHVGNRELEERSTAFSSGNV